MLDICEKLYQLNGFVKWSDVGKALGVSRQAVQLRLRAARENREQARLRDNERKRLELKIRLSPENAEWLRTECVFRKATSADIINGLINKERESR